MQTKVLFYWDTRTELKDYLKAGLTNSEIEMFFKDEISEKTLNKIVPEMDILVCWRPPKEMLEKASKLSVLINPGAGVQHLKDFKQLFKERGVMLINGHGNAYFTAQHVAAMLLAVTNRIIPHHNAMKSGKWRLGDDFAASVPLRNRHIGLLGYGHVNKLVHKFLGGFDLKFSILKKNLTESESNRRDYYSVEQLHDFLKSIDTLIIAVPYTEKTHNMIDKHELELLGKDGIIINAGRGAVVNEEALYNSLKDRTIMTAAIDVWYNYRPEPDLNGELHPAEYPFHKLDNVLLSPHRAASPFSDLKRWDEVIKNISLFSTGSKELVNIVDIEHGY